MGIFWKPSGSLDISTDPSDLPETTDQFTVSSGAMKRCKNLRIDNQGLAQTRHGSSVLYNVSPTDIEGIVEQNGTMYILTSEYVFREDVPMTQGIKVATPTFSPVAGNYASAQTVTISCSTSSVTIHYTLDSTDPTTMSSVYTSALTIPLWKTLKALATRTGYIDSEIGSAFYFASPSDLVTETSGNNVITETDANQVIDEGT